MGNRNEKEDDDDDNVKEMAKIYAGMTYKDAQNDEVGWPRATNVTPTDQKDQTYQCHYTETQIECQVISAQTNNLHCASVPKKFRYNDLLIGGIKAAGWKEMTSFNVILNQHRFHLTECLQADCSRLHAQSNRRGAMCSTHFGNWFWTKMCTKSAHLKYKYEKSMTYDSLIHYKSKYARNCV